MATKLINLKIPKGTKCKNGICEQDLDVDVNVDIPDETPPTIQGTAVPQLNNGLNTASAPEIKEVEKIVEKKVVQAPKDTPFYNCKGCGGKHDNPNYQDAPKYKCPNCGTLNGQKNCRTCGTETEVDDWDELDDDELTELGIPLPKLEDTHNHEHNEDDVS